MRVVIKMNEQDEVTLLNKDNLPVGNIVLKNNKIILKENSLPKNSYYQIREVEPDVLKCYSYLNDFLNNCRHQNMNKKLWANFNKVYDNIYEKVMGPSSDNIINHTFQCVVEYEIN